MYRSDKALFVVIIFGLVMMLFASFMGGRAYQQTKLDRDYYPKIGYVVYVDETADLILIEDPAGYRWIWDGAEDWIEGDICSMIMYNNNTSNIKDDEIVSIRYDGWVEGY